MPPTTNERMGRITNQIWQNKKEGFFYALVAAMLKSGFSENEIIKIGGDNYCRLFDKATSVDKKFN